ncbi:MAG TPA: hypothetical protein VMW10_07310, partial [Alphaproteobacteria bacterium]|nr:hypothetical protein [Alphaproteobacteria bacterium]
MFKKISYLTSVSILASVVMGTASYAVHEEELGEIITRFNSQPKAVRSSAEKEAPKEDASWWSYAASVGSVLKPAANSLGKAVRWGGDQLRGDTVMGDLLAEKGLGIASQYGGSSTKDILNKVGEKEGNSTSARQTCGNAVRWIGACLVEETPTLERALRQFWIDMREADEPDQALTSTASALYLYKDQIGGVAGVKTAYRKFVKAWNSDSWTVHSTDAEKIHESFVRGLIRGFVKDKKNVNNFAEMGAYLKAFGIDYENLPITKTITAESVAEKGENVKDVTLRRIEEARQK